MERQLLERLRLEARITGDATLDALYEEITLAEAAVEAFHPANAGTAMRLLGDVGTTL